LNNTAVFEAELKSKRAAEEAKIKEA